MFNSLYLEQISTKENFDTLSAMDIAEQLTFLDHKIFISIRSEYDIMLLSFLYLFNFKQLKLFTFFSLVTKQIITRPSFIYLFFIGAVKCTG